MEPSSKIKLGEESEDDLMTESSSVSESSDYDNAIMDSEVKDTPHSPDMQAKEDTKLANLTNYERNDNDVQFPHGQTVVDRLCSSMEQKQSEVDFGVLEGLLQVHETVGLKSASSGANDQAQQCNSQIASKLPAGQTQFTHAQSHGTVLQSGQQRLIQDESKGQISKADHHSPLQEHDKIQVPQAVHQDRLANPHGDPQRSDPIQDNVKASKAQGNYVQTNILEGCLKSIQDKSKVPISQAAMHGASGQGVQQRTAQNQSKNEATQQANQFHNKENREFVFFSWKDAKEFITMSWHLGQCKICRETFKRWKDHAIKEHGSKPVIHKIEGAGPIQPKVSNMLQQPQKGVLMQSRSSNQQQSSIGNVASKIVQKEGSITARIVRKHIFTTNKPQPQTNVAKPSPPGQYNCGLCNLQYKTEPELKRHLKVHAGQRIAFKCQKCDRVFLHQSLLQRHMAVHKEQNTTCKICGRKFPDVQKARRHRYTHGKKLTFKCDKCSKTYTSMQSLRIHKRTHSGDGMMPCKFCGKKFPSKFSLTSHERIHTGVKPYKCLYCNERFITHSAMRYHEQVHTGFKYMCQHCGKGYRDRSNLREHERTHTGEKPYKCEECPKTFTTGALLKYHRREHTGESYECQICKKLYKSQGILNTHMKSHSDVRPFICRFCGKGFREKATLKTHEKGVHLGVKFTCEMCKREFTQKSALKTHEKGVHGMHGHNKIKKEHARGQKQRPAPQVTSNPSVEPANLTVKGEVSSTSEQTGTEYRGEQDYVNSNPMPVPVRQVHPNPYDQVSVAHASMQPPYPMSSSDFHTMVDSLIQFSKDH